MGHLLSPGLLRSWRVVLEDQGQIEMVVILDDANDATPEAAGKGVIATTHLPTIGLADGAAQFVTVLSGGNS